MREFPIVNYAYDVILLHYIALLLWLGLGLERVTAHIVPVHHT